MRVTIRDVAREAGVSVSTVSYALNRKGTAIKDSHKRVLAAAERLGYVPDATARSLVNSRTNSVGVIISAEDGAESRNPFGVEMIGAFSDELVGMGNWMCLYLDKDGDSSKLESMLIDAKVDGLIWVMAHGNFGISQMVSNIITRRGFPLVSVSMPQEYSSLFDTNIHIMGAPGIEEAVDYLVELGHRDIVMFSSADRCHRTAVGKERLAKHGLEYRQIINAGFSDRVAYSEMDKLIKNGGPLPTAVMAANDGMAIGAMRAVRDNGFSVPGDVSVIGFDDIHDARITNPPLTTIRQDLPEVARIACQKIAAMRDGEENDTKFVTVDTKLVKRDSVANPRGQL